MNSVVSPQIHLLAYFPNLQSVLPGVLPSILDNTRNQQEGRFKKQTSRITSGELMLYVTSKLIMPLNPLTELQGREREMVGERPEG